MMKRWRLPLLLPALFLVACSELLTESYDYGTVRVQVTEPSGEPVSGVDLVLYTGVRQLAYGTTDANGAHVFRFVPFGEFGVRISSSAPEGYTRPEGESNNVGVELDEPGGEASVTIILIPREDAQSSPGLRWR